LVVVSVFPTTALPDITGSVVLMGILGVMALLVAVSEPDELVPVTLHVIFLFKSRLGFTEYWSDVASGI